MTAVTAIHAVPPALAAPGEPIDLLAVPLPVAPVPASLQMRAAPGNDAAAGASQGADEPDAGAPQDAAGDTIQDHGERLQRRLLRPADAPTRRPRTDDERRTVFRFNIGFGLDGGEPSGEALLNGSPLDETVTGSGDEATYARMRVYSFGDAVVGSRGIVAPSLSTYLGASFRFDQEFGRPSTAVPSVQDGEGANDIVVRSGYAEIQGPLDATWLEPLFVRAGRQYHYGPAVAHFDGLTLGYDTPALSVSGFVGQGVDVLGFSHGDLIEDQGALAGLSVRVDLFELGRGPLVLSGNLLAYNGHDHADGSVAYRWNRDISLQAGARSVDGAAARQYLRVRARISEVTLVAVDVDNRSRGDWMYDVLAIEPAQPTDPRRFLNLGSPLPRTYVGVRAGTVLLDNIDLLVRGGAAIEHADADEPASTYAASYAEAGAALEVRVRRTLVLGASALARSYGRDEQAGPDEDALDPTDNEIAGPLDLDTGHLGERSFFEGGGTARFTLGARRFGAGVEVYMRYYDTPPLHAELALERADVRGGGRFEVEGWAGERLRLKAEYDVSTALVRAPELSGVKSLRVLLEGRL